MSLALSIRQMRRQERLALQVLADSLLNHYDLKAETREDTSDPGLSEVNGAEASVLEQELDRIQQSYPSQAVHMAKLMDSLTQVIAPLAQAQRVRVEFSLPGDLPCVAVQLVPLRQAVLSVLTRAVQRVPGGLVQVFAEAVGRQVSIGIRPSRRAHTGEHPDANETGDLEMARRLAMLSGGSLEILPGTDGILPFTATLTLPTVEQALVLFVDDNADTLQLFRRYLEATRYPFVGTRDPEQAIILAEEFAPSIIVLDVMLPGIDGWELLGRLRQHPNTHGIPIIVCSILKEEQLALALGAVAFLAKPVSQTQLIAALDAQLGSHSPECP
jgi:CheY-like chemotaxis protein